MKKSLKLKLKKYKTILAGTLMGNTFLISESANGQIIYDDIIPDLYLFGAGNQFPFDMDSDADTDIQFTIFEGIYSGTGTSEPYTGIPYTLTMKGVPVNGIEGQFVSFNYEPMALNYGAVIGNGLTFTNVIDGLADYNNLYYQGIGNVSTNFYGQWSGVIDKYLGIKIINGANINYGWLRMSLNATADTLIIHDFAYNSVIGQSITAGQTTIGVNEIDLVNAITISPNPSNGIFNLKYNEITNFTEFSLTIYDITGKTLFNFEEKIESINLTDFSSGIYIVEIKTDTGIFREKILKQ